MVTLQFQTWILEVAAEKRIKLTFESFDVEGFACQYDYVQISFGSFQEKYCGSSKPSPITSSGNTMTVTFHTDYSENFKGFKATWEAVGSSGSLGISTGCLKKNSHVGSRVI